MRDEQDDTPGAGDVDGTLAGVDAAISSARRTVEDAKAVIEETRKLLQKTRDLTGPSPPPDATEIAAADRPAPA